MRARLALLILVVAPTLGAQDSVHFRRLIGVFDGDTQLPIVDAEVKDRLTGNSMRTSKTGHVALVPGFVRSTGAWLEIRNLSADAGRRGGFEVRCQSKLVSCVRDSVFTRIPRKSSPTFWSKRATCVSIAALAAAR